VRWDAAAPAVSHPYLRHKAVQPHGCRVDGSHLLVPMRDAEGRLHNLQTIAPCGIKRFMPGGRVKGLYFAIGRPSGKLVICEGYATAATIQFPSGIVTPRSAIHDCTMNWSAGCRDPLP
jgi:putative DNA primase/helicase